MERMIDRLRQPEGRLGNLSLFAAFVLGVVGVLGVVSLCVAAAVGSNFWADDPQLQLVSAVMFGFIADGAVGFLIMDRRPWLGVVLAVFGSIVFTFILLWTLVPIVLGPLFAITAINRAKVLSEQDGLPPKDPATA
jgi:ABC-type Mn2+/Zn2+ transport system permease subunit